MQKSPSIHIFEQNDIEKGGMGKSPNQGVAFNEGAKEVNDTLIQKTLEGTFKSYLQYSDENGTIKTGLDRLIGEDGKAKINDAAVAEEIIKKTEQQSGGKISEIQKSKIRKSVLSFMVSITQNSNTLKRAIENNKVIQLLNELKSSMGVVADTIQDGISELIKEGGHFYKILNKKQLTENDRKELLKIITINFTQNTLGKFAWDQYIKIDGKQKLLNLIIDVLHVTLHKGSFKNEYNSTKNTLINTALNTYKTGETQTTRVGNISIDNTHLSVEQAKSAKEKGDTTINAIQVKLVGRGKEKVEDNKKLLEDVLGGEANFHEFILYLGVRSKKWSLYTEQNSEVRGIIDSIYETYKNPVEQKYTKDIFGKDGNRIKKLEQLNKLQPITLPEGISIDIEKIRGADIVTFAKNLKPKDNKDLTRKIGTIIEEIQKRIQESKQRMKLLGNGLGKFKVDNLGKLGDKHGIKIPESLSKHKGRGLKEILFTLNEVEKKELEAFLLSLSSKVEDSEEKKIIQNSLQLIKEVEKTKELHRVQGAIKSPGADILMKAINGDEKAQQIAISSAIAGENIGRNQGSIAAIEAVSGLDLSNPANIEILRKQAGNNPDIQYLIEYARTEHKEIAEQIRLYEKEYGKAAAEKLYNSSPTTQKNGYNQYEFLNKNVYHVNNTPNKVLDTTLLHLETGDTINLIWENGESGGPKTYQVTSTGEGRYNISIPELGQSIEGLRFSEIQNAIGETQVLHSCGMDIFTPYIKDINEYNNKNGGKKIELQDRSFSEQESIAIIKQICLLLNLPEPNTNDISSLGNIMSYVRRMHENSPEYMFNGASIASWMKENCKKQGIINDSGIIKKQSLITLLGKG